MSKVWITRTQPAAQKTAKAVKAMGYIPLISPLLEITPPKTMPDIPPKSASLIFTSSNAVHMFCALTDRRDWPVVTVGDATAHIATAAGFSNVQSASGTSADVTALVKRTLTPDTPIVHCSGNIVRGTITEDLRAAEYHANRSIYYETQPLDAVPKVEDVDFLLLQSPLAAQTLYRLAPDCAHIRAVCLSSAVRDSLGTLALREIRVANAPVQTALLACLS